MPGKDEQLPSNVAAAGTTKAFTVPSAGRAASSYKWWLVALLWCVCFLNYADRQATSSVFPLLEQRFGFDKFQLGLIGSSFAWVYAAFSLPAGLLVDRLSRKKIIIGACLVWSAFTMATSWCANLPAFVAVRGLTGLGETFYFPAAMALLSAYHGPATRSTALAWHQSAVYAGTVLGSWLAALLAQHSGWQLPFKIFGPAGLGLAALLFALIREQGHSNPATMADAGQPDPKASLRETCVSLIRNPVTLLLMAGFAAANFVAVIFLTWTPTFLVRKFQFSLSAAGLSGAVYIHGASALAVPLAGYLADRLSRRFPGGRILVQLAGLLLGALFVFLVGSTSQVSALLFAMVAFGVCKGFYDSGIFASLYDTLDPRLRGSSAGLMNTVGWAGGALGAAFVGFATRYGSGKTDWENMSHAISGCSAVYVLAGIFLLLALILVRRQSRTDAPPPMP